MINDDVPDRLCPPSEKGSGTRDVFDRPLAGASLPRRIAFELEQPEVIRQSVRNGLGHWTSDGLKCTVIRTYLEAHHGRNDLHRCSRKSR